MRTRTEARVVMYAQTGIHTIFHTLQKVWTTTTIKKGIAPTRLCVKIQYPSVQFSQSAIEEAQMYDKTKQKNEQENAMNYYWGSEITRALRSKPWGRWRLQITLQRLRFFRTGRSVDTHGVFVWPLIKSKCTMQPEIEHTNSRSVARRPADSTYGQFHAVTPVHKQTIKCTCIASGRSNFVATI